MKLTRKTWMLFLALMCLVNMIVCVQHCMDKKTGKISLGESLVSLTGEITSTNTVRSTFCGNGQELAGLDVFFSTFNRKNDGIVICAISVGENVIFKNTVNMETIEDNSFHKIDASGIFLEDSVEYTLSLSADSEQESVTAWLDENGTIVANIYTLHKLTITKLLLVNLVYALVNYLLCLMISLLKRK